MCQAGISKALGMWACLNSTITWNRFSLSLPFSEIMEKPSDELHILVIAEDLRNYWIKYSSQQLPINIL